MLSVVIWEDGGGSGSLSNVMGSGRKSVVTEPLKQAPPDNGIQYKTKAAL